MAPLHPEPLSFIRSVMNCQEIVYNDVQACRVSFRWHQCQSIICEVPHNNRKFDILSSFSVDIAHPTIDDLCFRSHRWAQNLYKLFNLHLNKSSLILFYRGDPCKERSYFLCFTSDELSLATLLQNLQFQDPSIRRKLCHSVIQSDLELILDHCCSSTIDEL